MVSWSNKKLLVLGCGGFIGSHFLDRLLATKENYEVKGWDINHHKISHLTDHPRLDFRKASVEDMALRGTITDDIAQSDMVINLAALCNPSQYNTEPVRTIFQNFIDSYHIAEIAARFQKPLIHFSTSEVYGRTIQSYVGDGSYKDPALYQLDPETTPLVMGPVQNQRWTYACAKQLYERLIYGLHHDQGMPFAIIRPFNFFGPRMDYLPGIEGEGKPRVLAIFVANLILGRPLELVDGGHAKRTITSIHDAIDALMAIIEKPETRLNRIYNIGNADNEISMAELAYQARAVMAEVTGDQAYHQHPVHEVSSADFYGKGYEDCDRRIMDISQEMRILDWKPSISVEGILKETLSHYWQLYGNRKRTTA